MKALGFVARWLGPVLVLLGVATWLGLAFDATHPFDLVFPAAAILPGLGAFASAIAWFATRSSERPTSRTVLAAAAIGGAVFCAWSYGDEARAYRQVTVSFDNRGARLVGTLYLPNRPGKVPGIVMVHGAEAISRSGYKAGPTNRFARSGYAVLVYDKRGVGDSSGKFERDCNTCPDNVDLLAGDASAALSLLAARPEVRADKVGFWGASQAGWIVPKAAVMNGHAAFMILVSGPTTTAHQNMIYERFTGGKDPGGGLTPDQADALADRSPKKFDFPGADFDPLPDLRALDIPGLWLFGERDWLVPPGKSIANLQGLIQAGEPYDYRIIPGAGHSMNPAPQTLVRRITDDWLARVTAEK
jgi:uncharacterized protein